MAPPTPIVEPQLAVSADTWRWRHTDEVDYPQSEGWTLKYAIAGPQVIEPFAAIFQTSGDDAGYWVASLTPTETGALTDGLYYLRGYFLGSGDHDGEEYTVYNGRLEVLPDVRAAAAGDLEDHADKLVKAIDAVLAGRIDDDVESYQIAGRSITLIPVSELMKLRSFWGTQRAMNRSGRFGTPISIAFTGR